MMDLYLLIIFHYKLFNYCLSFFIYILLYIYYNLYHFSFYITPKKKREIYSPSIMSPNKKQKEQIDQRRSHHI